jgi:hypothetical protein
MLGLHECFPVLSAVTAIAARGLSGRQSQVSLIK